MVFAISRRCKEISSRSIRRVFCSARIASAETLEFRRAGYQRGKIEPEGPLDLAPSPRLAYRLPFGLSRRITIPASTS